MALQKVFIFFHLVCGEGVEKARDEIKRLDKSVQNYLEAYDDHIASGPLVLKVSLFYMFLK